MNKKQIGISIGIAIGLGLFSFPANATTYDDYNKMVTQTVDTIKSKDIIKNASQFTRLQGIKIIETKPWLKKSNQIKKLSNSELRSILRQVGFSGKNLEMAIAIAFYESTLRPYALNRSSNCYGLFQINMSGAMGKDRREKYGLAQNEDLFNPVVNASIAYKMSNGGKDWSAWSTEKLAKRLINN